MDERKLRLYRWMLNAGKILLENIPEPYKSAIQ